MPHTSQKTFKNSANTAEIRTPFGVNYDSSKRKVRVLHFFSIRYTREIWKKSLPLYLYLLIRIYSISILLRISNSIIESTYKLFNMKIFMFCIFLVVVDITTTSGNLRRQINCSSFELIILVVIITNIILNNDMIFSMYVQVRNWIQMCCRCLRLDWMYAFDQYQLQGQWCYRRLRHNHRQWMCTLYSSAKTLRDHLRLLCLKGPRFA